MAFNGTTHFKKNELVEYLQSVGMRFGGDLNAGTSYDETVYRLTIPTDTVRVVKTALQILDDWTHGMHDRPEGRRGGARRGAGRMARPPRRRSAHRGAT